MFLRRKGNPECRPSHGELWLLSGDFRVDEAVPGMTGLYCIPGGYETLTAPSGWIADMEKFHAAVRYTIERLSQEKPVAVEIWDCTHNQCPVWETRFSALRQMALEQCVSFRENIVNGRKRYWFIFRRFPQEFHEKIYRCVHMDFPYEDIYLTYSVLAEEIPPAFGANSASAGKIALNLHMDWDHLAFILQMEPDYPRQRIIDALSAACTLENRIFCDYTEGEKR